VAVVCAQNLVRLDLVTESLTVGRDDRTSALLLNLLDLPFKYKSYLAAENAALRQQVIVLQRKIHGRVEFTDHERLLSSNCIAGFPRS